ncbi:hypothetical protein TRAPUB_3654 [Trametes pubescens]|uniref:Uncharacterized protein n=1 Tax=Trametes pubescens TaxID=154538 RepID=A0A1M2VDB8_TRAPU|nr:hypothetical protein TRAPUB_3654 [Trametes pubescens]
MRSVFPRLDVAAGAGLRGRLDYLGTMGVSGDLEVGFQLVPQFPDMDECSRIPGEAVALINARTYSLGKTSFACQIARPGGGAATAGAKRNSDGDATAGEDGRTDIIAILKEYAGRIPGMRKLMGAGFVHGNKEASGGGVRTADLERVWEVLPFAQEGRASSLRRSGGCLSLRIKHQHA